MKFKAQIHDKDKLFKIFTMLDKIGKEYYFVLSQEQFVVHFKTTQASGIKVRMEIDMAQIFSEITIQSLSDDHIYMEGDTKSFLHAIKSCLKMEYVLISLTKRENYPYLSIVTKPKPDIKIVQDIPVNILKKDEFESNLQMPSTEDCDVQINLPNDLKTFYSLIDKYRAIDCKCIVSANMGGRMMVKVESTQASVMTYFKDLVNPPFTSNDSAQTQGTLSHTHTGGGVDSGDGSTQRDHRAGGEGGEGEGEGEEEREGEGMQNVRAEGEDRHAEVALDIRKFIKILGCHIVSPPSAIACIFDQKAFVLHAFGDSIYITFEIPHVQ